MALVEAASGVRVTVYMIDGDSDYVEPTLSGNGVEYLIRDASTVLKVQCPMGCVELKLDRLASWIEKTKKKEQKVQEADEMRREQDEKQRKAENERHKVGTSVDNPGTKTNRANLAASSGVNVAAPIHSNTAPSALSFRSSSGLVSPSLPLVIPPGFDSVSSLFSQALPSKPIQAKSASPTPPYKPIQAKAASPTPPKPIQAKAPPAEPTSALSRSPCSPSHSPVANAVAVLRFCPEGPSCMCTSVHGILASSDVRHLRTNHICIRGLVGKCTKYSSKSCDKLHFEAISPLSLAQRAYVEDALGRMSLFREVHPPPRILVPLTMGPHEVKTPTSESSSPTAASTVSQLTIPVVKIVQSFGVVAEPMASVMNILIALDRSKGQMVGHPDGWDLILVEKHLRQSEVAWSGDLVAFLQLHQSENLVKIRYRRMGGIHISIDSKWKHVDDIDRMVRP